MTSTQHTESLWKYYTWLFLGIMVVASWTHYIDPVINTDGVMYVLTGEAFVRGDFQAGWGNYKWPFYPLSIAAFSYISGVSVEISALLFNALCRCLTGFAFVRLLCQFGANTNQLVIGTALFIFYPGLNEVQSMIIRDLPYLACLLWMVVFYLDMMRNPNRWCSAGFVAMGLLATAYRLEGAVFAAGLLARYLFFTGQPSRHRSGLALAAVLVLFPLIAYEVLQWFYRGPVDVGATLTHIFHIAKREVAALTVTVPWLQWITGLPSWLIAPVVTLLRLSFNIIEIMSLGVTLILIAGLFVRPLCDPTRTDGTVIQVWHWLIGINLLMLVGFTFRSQIFTDRYPLSLALFFMLFLPFAITRLVDIARRHSPRRGKVAIWTLSIMLILNTIEGLDRFTSKYHLRAAGLWIAEHTGGEYEPSKFYTNNSKVDYYAGQPLWGGASPYHYPPPEVLTDNYAGMVAIALFTDHIPDIYRHFMQRNGGQPDKQFENHKGHRVLIYDFRSKQAQADSP